MSKPGFAASFAVVGVLLLSQASASPIVENTAGTLFALSPYLGESFTMPSSGGPWNDITFNFFSDVPAMTPTAAGSAYLFDQPYLGTPAGLSSSAPGFLGLSTGIAGGMYVFPTNLVLDPGTQYFLYENGAIPFSSGGNAIAGGEAYYSAGFNDFTPNGLAQSFAVSGTPVPEPSSLIVLASGLLGFGFLLRARQSAS